MIRFFNQGEYHFNWAMYWDDWEEMQGVSHIDDLFLQWDWEHLNEEDSRVSLAMTTMWTNFAKYGNPTPAENNLGFVWDPVTKDDIRLTIDKKKFNCINTDKVSACFARFLVIDNEMTMDLDLDYQERMEFWDSIAPNITYN